MTEQGNDDRVREWWQSKGMMTEQGDDDRAGGRWQSKGMMTEQGDDDRAREWWQSKGMMTEQGDDDRARERWQSRGTMTELGDDDKARERWHSHICLLRTQTYWLLFVTIFLRTQTKRLSPHAFFHGYITATVFSWVFQTLSFNLFRKFKTLQQDSFWKSHVINNVHPFYKNSTGFPYQSASNTKMLVCFSMLSPALLHPISLTFYVCTLFALSI